MGRQFLSAHSNLYFNFIQTSQAFAFIILDGYYFLFQFQLGIYYLMKTNEKIKGINYVESSTESIQ